MITKGGNLPIALRTNFVSRFYEVTYYGGTFRTGLVPMSSVTAEPMVTSLAVSYCYFMRICTNDSKSNFKMSIQALFKGDIPSHFNLKSLSKINERRATKLPVVQN